VLLHYPESIAIIASGLMDGTKLATLQNLIAGRAIP
jgi:hypothetical protein